MVSNLVTFERIVRRAHRVTEAPARAGATDHPFEARNIHPDFPAKVRELFDDGHFAQATFEAFKFLDEEVQRISGSSEYGRKLMMQVFGGAKPVLALNSGMTPTEKSEQEGFKFMFAGSMAGIRNPRGHVTSINDDPDGCLDHLSFASMLLRRLDQARIR